MKIRPWLRPLAWPVILALAVGPVPAVQAQTPGADVNRNNTNVCPIDLPTALRLADAQNLDVQIARQALNEARANHESAVEQFIPWLSPGIGYHRRDGQAQAVPSGLVSDAHFQSYSPGATFSAQLPLGDAIYQSLASRQQVRASDQALATQRQNSALSAAQGYFDLAKARALVDVAREAMEVSRNYQNQLHEAVGTGIAFKGDELRVQTQTERDQTTLRQALEQQRVAAARLSQTLHLDATVELVPQEADLVPLMLVATNASLDGLLAQALGARPELKQRQALVQAASEASKGATYGPLIPSLSAQVFAGGLGGGPDGSTGNFGPSEDYLLGLSWRIGPGGLFDSGRKDASKARLAAAKLDSEKIRDDIIRQVVEGQARMLSWLDQIAGAKLTLATAAEALRLTQERKQFGVGIVLENLQAQQELVRARTDYVSALAEFNKAQYNLKTAAGNPD